MKKGELIIAAISIIALGMNLLLIPYGDTLTILTLSSLSALYMYLSFALLNGIRLRDIFKKNSYKGISELKIVLAAGTGLALSMTTIGILFIFQAWPFASYNLSVGLVGLSAVSIFGIINNLKDRSVYYTRIFKRAAVFGGLGLFFLLMPHTTWVAIKYRNHPTYIDALKKAMADPDNEELWNSVEEERQKMSEEK